MALGTAHFILGRRLHRRAAGGTATGGTALFLASSTAGKDGGSYMYFSLAVQRGKAEAGTLREHCRENEGLILAMITAGKGNICGVFN